MTYETMKAAVAIAHEGMVSGNWTKLNVEAFMRVNGLNSDAIRSTIKCATNCKLFAMLQVESVNDPEEFDAIVQKKIRNPMLFQRWKYPAVWDRGVKLSQHVDAVMHLIFLGIVKTCIKRIQTWATLRGKNSAFLIYSLGTMESVQSLGLDWCHCVPYKIGKLGGWVSENYLAMCRLLSWFYGSIDEVASDVVFNPPDLEQKKWSKKHNQGWLRARGLNINGNAEELRKRVKEYLLQPGGGPPLSLQQGGEVSNVYNMVVALKAMVARTMSSIYTAADIEETERHIKIFLNTFETFDAPLRTEKDTPTWISSYNFVCLLNIPKMIRDFGPLRNLWEGGGQGEKIVSLIKPSWVGYRKNWQANAMDSLLKKMAMERLHRIVSPVNDESEDNNIIIEEELVDDIEQGLAYSGKNYHRYKNLEALISDFSNRKPLSVVLMRNNSFASILRNDTAVEVVCGELTNGLCAGASYHYWSIGNEQGSFNKLCCVEYCMLLPKLSQGGMPNANDDPIFTLITSDWNEIQPNKLVRKPKVPFVTYN